MKLSDSIEKKIRDFTVQTPASADQRILAQAIGVLKQSTLTQAHANDLGSPFRRFFMKNTWTKLAFAAMIVLTAGIIFVSALDQSSTPAYALEQTIQANHSVRSLHIFNEYQKSPMESAKEIWVEFDDFGELHRSRIEIQNSRDGWKSIVWHDNKADIWFRAKISFVTIKDKTIAMRMLEMVKSNDPLLLVEQIKTQSAEGKVKIEIKEPSDTNARIVVTATFLPGSSTPDKKLILFVNQKAKLVEIIEEYKQTKDQYELQNRRILSQYNQPIDEKLFTLEVPADAIRIDQTTQNVGLLQGALSNEDIATEVVREFFEALIAQDFNKAGQLMGGVPGSVLEKSFKDATIVRIISMGKPEPHPETRSLRVPCTIEIEKNGMRVNFTPHGPFVRQVDGQPERWAIIGGI